MKKLIILAMAFGMALAMQANDHVMDATKPAETKQAPASLSLSLKEAQDYAVRENRSPAGIRTALADNSRHAAQC